MEALRNADPVFVVLGFFGVLGVLSWLFEKLGLVPRIRTVTIRRR